MSLVFPIREAAKGPTVVLQGQGTASVSAAASVATPPMAYVGVPVYLRVACDGWVAKGEAEEAEEAGRVNGFGLGGRKGGEEKEAESSESSSIGAGEESSLSLSSSTAAEEGGDGEEEEVQSKLKKGTAGLGSLDSLEESLPIKRGLSNCFSGKSKSFASLSEAAVLGTAKDLAKVENPFNKRRRVLMACKASWQRRASYAALNTSNLWALEEDQEYDDDDGRGGSGGDGGNGQGVPESPTRSPFSTAGKQLKSFKSFKSPRSFSLSDLQKHA